MHLSIASLFIPFMVQNVYLAPVLALEQGLVSLRMHAVAGAVFLLILHTIGPALLAGEPDDRIRPGVCRALNPGQAR
ncbi:hypothetical protein [Microbulbifer marinus]|uniref:hypothetical protein n=1 Tax=Microbulbifer marinus TaxID=658218 RepID=UPI00111519CB|nr:hypothetical protein [Microbulbifer marinus]